VFVFEPNPDNYRLLAENVKMNALHNVELSLKAVTSHAGEREFHVDGGNTGGRSLYVPAGKSAVAQVDSVNIIDALKKWDVTHVDYLKMDCEGAEWEIIEALHPPDMDMFPRIVMEVHILENRGWEEMIAMLRDRGYWVAEKEVGDGHMDTEPRSVVRMSGNILYAKRH
jgi:FkbM family methyltransferase